MSEEAEKTTAERFSIYPSEKYDAKYCLAAIRAEQIPFGLKGDLIQASIVRGIRYQPAAVDNEFGSELYSAKPIFSRALNARRIMSDSLHLLPDQLPPEETPYCIWHPRTALESTYRQLAARYPQLKYQVARACAVANYITLYRELEILPDVHIAEEARECGSKEIYQLIVTAPVRYSIMNDYTLSVHPENLEPACLNGDTAVRWTLEIKRKCPRSPIYAESFHYRRGTFDITEDGNIDEQGLESHDRPKIRYDLTLLLTEPLPRDLPTTEKDLLICMAAYHGNLERYTRLRRPHFAGPSEWGYVIRGIFHNTQFAIWWSRQKSQSKEIIQAINARFIMNNVLSTIDENTPEEHLPYCVWYPTLAQKATYQELYRRQPKMASQILRACMEAGYKELFDMILAETKPDKWVAYFAESKLNLWRYDRYYKQKIEQRGTKEEPPTWIDHSWKSLSTGGSLGSSNYYFPGMSMDANLVNSGTWDGIYNGRMCEVDQVDFLTSLPEEWKRQVSEDGPFDIDYGFFRTMETWSPWEIPEIQD